MPLLENALTVVSKIRLAISSEDKEDLINAASSIIEDHCNTKFCKSQYDIILKPNGEHYLPVNFWNIDSVESVTFNDSPIEDYTILKDQGMLYKADGWPKANDYLLEITLNAGFVLPNAATEESPRTLPLGIEHACILLANQLYYQDGIDFRVQSQSIKDMKESYFENPEGNLPGPVHSLLSKWRFIPV